MDLLIEWNSRLAICEIEINIAVLKLWIQWYLEHLDISIYIRWVRLIKNILAE